MKNLTSLVELEEPVKRFTRTKKNKFPSSPSIISGISIQHWNKHKSHQVKLLLKRRTNRGQVDPPFLAESNQALTINTEQLVSSS